MGHVDAHFGHATVCHGEGTEDPVPNHVEFRRRPLVSLTLHSR